MLSNRVQCIDKDYYDTAMHSLLVTLKHKTDTVFYQKIKQFKHGLQSESVMFEVFSKSQL